jgi:mannose-6-phosphate isomerase
MVHLLRPIPDLRERVWGGSGLGAGGRFPIGEAWLAGPASRIGNGPDAGLTLEDVARRDGASFIGHDAAARTGGHFPLLVKLLDASQWLSVQVHPDDATARRLEGPDAVGKTEAWYVLDAEPGAELLLGVADGVTEAEIRAAIREAPEAGEPRVAPLLRRIAPRPGQAYPVPAGVLHAVGPGLLLYELQQASDITYRCEDWGRPSTPERPLHTEQSLASLIAGGATPKPEPPQPEPGGPHSVSSQPPGSAAPGRAARETLVACEYFVIERLVVRPGSPVEIAPGGASLHVLTALAPVRVQVSSDPRTGGGGSVLAGDGEIAELAARDTLVVAASTPRCTVSATSDGEAFVLVGRVGGPAAG